MVEIQTTIFSWKLAVVSEEFIVIGSLFQIVGAATGKVHLPILSLVLGTEVVLEAEDLTVLRISGKPIGLTKRVGCWI